jgi:hypothetical protein
MRMSDQKMAVLIAALFFKLWLPEIIARICNEFPFEFVF